MGKKKKPQAAVLCDYCGGPTLFVSDAAVYSRSYGSMIYLCKPCDAWVGVHKDTKIPKGRLAKAELRKLKIEAHHEFDPLWRAAMRLRGWTQKEARKRAYQWLATILGIEFNKCHIGMFDEEQCRRTIYICKRRERVPETAPISD